MTDTWINHKEVKYADESVKQIHVDTRDFHCLVQTEDHTEEVPFDKLLKYGKEFFYTPKEVEDIVNYLFDKSGGERKWRMMCFKKLSCGWELKYIRFYKTEYGFVACNRDGKFKRKDFWVSEIDQEHLPQR
jgi:hypothetical protein